eukprot:TCONS_00018711-protein
MVLTKEQSGLSCDNVNWIPETVHFYNNQDTITHDEKTGLLSYPKKDFLTVPVHHTSSHKSYQSISPSDSFQESCHSDISTRSILLTYNGNTGTLGGGISLVMTVASILPFLQGASVFSLPYAFVTAGKAFLPAFLTVNYLATLCSRLLMDSIYVTSPDGTHRHRIYNSYADLAFACWGQFGAVIMKILNYLFFLLVNVVNCVLFLRCLDNMLVGQDKVTPFQIQCVLLVLLIPIVLAIKDVSIFSYFGLFSTLSVLLACVMSMFVLIQRSDRWIENFELLPVIDWGKYRASLGITMLTMFVAPTLPGFESVMAEPKRFPTAINIAFGVSGSFKAVFGVIGALSFGSVTQEMLATNISESSLTLRFVVGSMLIINTLLNITFFMFTLLDSIDCFVYQHISARISSELKFSIPWKLTSRIVYLIIVLATSQLLPFFALASGVIGAVLISILGFIAPVLFHLTLKWHVLSIQQRFGELMLLFLTIFVGATASHSSCYELVKEVKKYHGLYKHT